MSRAIDRGRVTCEAKVCASFAIAIDAFAIVKGPDDCIEVTCVTSLPDALTGATDGMAAVNAPKTIVLGLRRTFQRANCMRPGPRPKEKPCSHGTGLSLIFRIGSTGFIGKQNRGVGRYEGHRGRSWGAGVRRRRLARAGTGSALVGPPGEAEVREIPHLPRHSEMRRHNGFTDVSGGPVQLQFRFDLTAEPAVDGGAADPERSVNAFDLEHFRRLVVLPLDPDTVVDGLAAGLEDSDATSLCFPTQAREDGAGDSTKQEPRTGQHATAFPTDQRIRGCVWSRAVRGLRGSRTAPKRIDAEKTGAFRSACEFSERRGRERTKFPGAPRRGWNSGKLSLLHFDERKEPMKTILMPGDPKLSAAFLPDVSRTQTPILSQA
jgi:hypothetical protein